VVIGAWHEDEGEWETAEAWYAKADDGENPLALVGLASLRSHLGQPEKAEQLYERSLAVGGARAVEYQARHLAKQGEHDLALHLAERSFEHGNHEALTGLAWTYISTDKSRAFAVMEHAMNLGFRDAITELIILSDTVENSDLTLAYCDLAEQAGSPNALRVAGTIHSRKGDERRAAALLWRAFNGGLHWALFELGELREKQGRTRSARRIYQRLAKTGQTYALVKLAALHERAGDCTTAERLARSYERISPLEADKAGWYEIAEVRQERGDVAAAEALLWRLVAAGDSHALVSIADLRLKAGDESGANDILRRAIDSGVVTAKASLAKAQ
jgi:tetratricopeptide (TPR) repeat protein